MRSMGLSEKERKHLELQSGYTSILSESPLFRYYFAMKTTMKVIAKSPDNKDVPSRCFDLRRSSLLLPIMH